jgi:DnaJ-class molecular chaperone
MIVGCPKCKGSGKVKGTVCKQCRGSGDGVVTDISKKIGKKIAYKIK